MFPTALTRPSRVRFLPAFRSASTVVHADRHAVDVVDVVDVRARRVLLHELPVQLDRGVVLPLRIGRVLEEDDRDRAVDDLVRPALGGEQHDVRRRRDGVVDDAAASSRACSRRRTPGSRTCGVAKIAKTCRARASSASRPAPGRRTRSPRSSARRSTFAFDRCEPALEAEQQILAVVVVLEEHRDPRVGLRAGEVLAEQPALGLVARLERRSCTGTSRRRRRTTSSPVAAKSCGTFFAFR